MSSDWNFCTLFDSNFLLQGVALSHSLAVHAPGATLWVLCMDRLAYDVLSRLNAGNMKLLNRSDFESEALLAAKKNRGRGEYCWTLTPFLPDWVMAADSTVDGAIYLDADCFFWSSPERLLKPFFESGRDVMITPHFYDPKYDQSETSGIYCVQFVPFRRTDAGREVLKWWQDKCLDWCYARYEDGKFGDQKYLDDWPKRFPEAVFENEDALLTLAPWNVNEQFRIHGSFSPCLYHFHGLQILRGRNGGLRFRDHECYTIPDAIRASIYRPYVALLRDLFVDMKELGWSSEFSEYKENAALHAMRWMMGRTHWDQRDQKLDEQRGF